MAKFSITLTQGGQALLARAQAGTPLNLSHVVIGDGLPGQGEDLTARTALISPKLTLPVMGLAHTGNQATVRADITNAGVAVGFYFREIGILADDPDHAGQEILYAIGNAGAQADYLPAGGGENAYEAVLDILIAVATTATVTATIEQSAVYALQRDLDAHVGHGGTAQHPAATNSLAGFMSAADKASFDAGNAAWAGKLHSQNGYQKFPGGLIMQWGTVDVRNGTTVTFPLPFPTACLSAQVSCTTSSSMSPYANTLTKNTMQVAIDTGSTSARVFNWWAIGY